MKKIGIAFEGGGLKGGYHVGAYYAFLKCHVKVKGVVGTSIGAFNACAIACGNFEKLYSLWENLEPGNVLGFSTLYSSFFNGESSKINVIKGFNQTIFHILKSRGIDTKNMKELAKTVISEEELKKSKMDFGLVTVKFRKLQPIYLEKSDIKEGKLIDSILASCSLPIFKLEPIIDNSIYLDGGFYDNCPTIILAKKNYDLVYEIRIKGIGRNRKNKYKNTKVITIKPSRNLCRVLELNKKNITNNILMGYYDTIKILKKYDGYKYVFKKVSANFINLITRKLSDRQVKRLMVFFKAKTKKEALIKAVEYVLENEKVNYFNVYNFYMQVKFIKKLSKETNFIYKYINMLSII